MDDFISQQKTLLQKDKWQTVKGNISNSALVKNHESIDKHMTNLELPRYTVLSLALIAKASKSDVDKSGIDIFHKQLSKLINDGDKERIIQNIDLFFQTCRVYAKYYLTIQTVHGIKLISEAIKKIQKDKGEMTSLHSELFQLCLTVKCFKPALEFLDEDVTDIKIEGFTFDVKYYLLYYYYGGCLLLAVKRYNDAMACFQAAVTVPAHVTSKIMIEAHKKHILLSLIIHGKKTDLPKYTSNVVERYVNPKCSAYNELAEAYTSNNFAKFEQVRMNAQFVNSTFNQDQNGGLVKQVRKSLITRLLQRLTKTFLTISLSDISNRISKDALKDDGAAEKYLLQMIEERKIFATINQEDGMVTFHNDLQSNQSLSVLNKLSSEIDELIDVNEKLQSMDKEYRNNSQNILYYTTGLWRCTPTTTPVCAT